MGTYSQLKQIKQSLRYKQLDNVIGDLVYISEFSKSESEIRSNLSPRLPYLMGTRKNDGLEKYRHIYIDFELSGSAPECPLQDLRLLREYGLLPTKEEIKEMDEALPPTDPDFTYLDMIIEELEEEKMWIKLFMKPVNENLTQRTDDGNFISKNFLPTDFKVVDACQTNIAMIWLCKHFYM